MTTQAEAIPVPTTEQDEFQWDQVLSITGGHLVHDTFSAFVAPMLPLIIEKLSLSLTQAGSLWSFMQLPALLNPFIGYLADRLSLRYFVILAPAITATLMSLLGLAPNYLSLAIILFASGISVAAFHAPAPPMIARISGSQVGKGMSLFMAGGELARTVGPLLVVWAVSTWSMSGYYPVMVLGWAASVVLYWRLRNISAQPASRRSVRSMLPAIPALFGPLLGIVISRQFMMTGLAVYLPIYMSRKGASLWMAGASLSIWELAGIAGALLGGTLSDRFGRTAVLLVVMGSSPLVMVAFLNSSGWLLVPILLLLGFISLASAPVLLAIVQDHFPHNRAVANGLYMSMTFLVRTVVAFLIGLVGDNFGLSTAYLWAALLSLAGIPMVFYLPDGREGDGSQPPSVEKFQ